MPLADDTYSLEMLRDPARRERAFAAMVRHLTPMLYGHVRRIVQFHDDADDVLQNTFLKAWQALPSFRGDCSLSTWLYRIAVNESLAMLSRRREYAALSDDGARDLESDPYFDGDETELQLQRAVALLPDKQRVVFNLKYFGEMKYEEMSQTLGTSVGALKASYHIAVKKVEAYFHELE